MAFMDDMAALAADFAAGDMFTDAVLLRSVPGTYDPVAGTVTGGSTSTIPCRGVLGKVKVTTDEGVRIEASGATLNVEPKIGDVLTIGTQSFTVTVVDTIAPHGSAILWKVVVA